MSMPKAGELIAALSGVGGLRVAPRSSSFRFRDAEDAQEAVEQHNRGLRKVLRILGERGMRLSHDGPHCRSRNR